MSLLFRGTTALTVENIERSYSESNGWESVYIYKGPWSAIDAAKTNLSYVGNASRVEVKQEPGGYGVLTVAFASLDNSTENTETYLPDTDNWTFTPYKIQKFIWEAPYFNVLNDARITSGTNLPGYKKRLVAAIEAYRSTAQSNASTNDFTNPTEVANFINYIDSVVGLSSAQKQAARDLCWMLLNDEDTYEVSKYTLRNTRILPANTSLAVNHIYTGYQWTTNRVVDLILSQQTSVTKYAICGDLLGYFAGTYWRKEAPIINELQGGKFEVVQEFTNFSSGELNFLIYPIFS